MGTKCTTSHKPIPCDLLTDNTLWRLCYSFGLSYILYLFKFERTSHIRHRLSAWRAMAPHGYDNRKLLVNKHLQTTSKA